MGVLRSGFHPTRVPSEAGRVGVASERVARE